MQRNNGVIDLSTYREAEARDEGNSDAGPQYLPAGTELLLGQYRITGYLNCGGFGITYVAKDSLDRTVVIKECFPSEMCYRTGKTMAVRTPRFKYELASIVRHFVAEAHRLANVRHHNIVHVHQVFEENETAYIAMDFIDGPDLLDIVMDDPKRFSPKEVVELTKRLLAATKHVHDLGFLHRDISPDNILIDKEGEPVLIDFGSAREYAQNSRRPFSRLKFVKDGYSPQEFYLAGSEQGTWSDIYSLAASIYHVISGHTPVDGQARIAAVAAKKQDPYEPLSGRISGYPSHFLNALDSALAVMPKDRLQTADNWLEMISPQAESNKKRPLAAVVDHYAKKGVIGTIPRFAERKRAIAASVIIAGAGIVGLTALQVIGVGGQGDLMASAAVIQPKAKSVEIGDPSNLVPVALTHSKPDLPSEGPSAIVLSEAPGVLEDQLEDLSIAAPDSGPDSSVPVLLFQFVAKPVAFVPPDPLFVVSDPMISVAVVAAPKATDIGHSPAPMGKTPDTPLVLASLPLVNSNNSLPDIAPPPASVSDIGPQQISWSQWNIRMPFEDSAARVRNANTTRVSAVSPEADLTVSGDWIAEDVVIYSFNGKRLLPDTKLATHVLASLSIDPDGYTRATVRYRDPETERIDRGLLAVPVVRETGLVDGTMLEARMENATWVTRVAEPGPGTDLRVGDIIIGESQSETNFTGYDDIARALTVLADRQIAQAEFTVLRDGTRQKVRWRLSPE